MGATHQCIVKWPGWMSSKEAMGHVSSFMFGHFLLSGPKRNMYPRCGNTFWQDSMIEGMIAKAKPYCKEGKTAKTFPIPETKKEGKKPLSHVTVNCLRNSQ